MGSLCMCTCALWKAAKLYYGIRQHGQRYLTYIFTYSMGENKGISPNPIWQSAGKAQSIVFTIAETKRGFFDYHMCMCVYFACLFPVSGHEFAILITRADVRLCKLALLKISHVLLTSAGQYVNAGDIDAVYFMHGFNSLHTWKGIY